MPSDTYAYSTQQPFIMNFDIEVQIVSFWLRLHRSPKAYLDHTTGSRTVYILLGPQVVAETTFLLSSDEWILIKPQGQLPTIGDSIVVEEGTDIDSIVVSWGDNVKFHQKLNEINSKLLNADKSAVGTLQPFKVVKNSTGRDGSDEKPYHLKAVNHLIIEKL